MKAAVWRGPGTGHAVETVPDPEPAAGEVVIRVERSGVCGSDISLTAERDRPTLLGPGFEAAYASGAVLGHEFCGTIVEVGKGVDAARVGERISPLFFFGCGRCAACLAGRPQECAEAGWFMGGYAQFALARPDCAVTLPAELSLEEGALVEPLATSLRTTRAAGIEPGDRVLVLGAGALGLGVIHFARRLGAAQVVAVARTDAKAAAARRMGADELVASPEPVSPERIAELFGGPPDVVIETAGAPGLVDAAIACVRPGATVVVAGLCLDPEPTGHAVASMKNLTIRYTSAYELRDFEVVTEMLRRADPPALDMDTELVDLDGFSGAFEARRSGGGAGKLMLDPWGGAKT